MASRGSTGASTTTPALTFNQTAPLMEEELQRVKSGSKSGFSDGSSDMSGSQGKKGKITPTSEVRYYGRGKSCKFVELSFRQQFVS
jgi:hypothetical protein